jgi:aminoglycoside/choline kinase family phosphotransferase
MAETVVLTPAQIDFLTRSFDGFEAAPGGVAELAGQAASQRYFVRIRHAGDTYILIVWDSRDEDWERFLGIGRDRSSTGALLPRIYADDPRHGLILEEDLGSVTLKQLCADASDDPAAIAAAYRQTLDALYIWQYPPAVNPHITARAMDEATFLWETSYFARFCVTDYCGCEAMLGDAWERERTRLARMCAALPATVMHRDFQSENVMLHRARIRFVDFQGARLGPPQYDVASLLFDPYAAAIDDALRDDLYRHYLAVCGRDDAGGSALRLCAAQRLMQALGAYGNLSLHKAKERYREFIPLALALLDGVMRTLDGFPAIAAIVANCRGAAAK